MKFGKILAGITCMAVIGAGAGAIAGCGGGKTTISVSGSTSVNEIMEVLAGEYEKTHDVRIQINVNGSGVGITDTIEGRNEIGMSSRNLEEDEIEDGVEGKQLCIDGIVLAVGKDCAANTVTNEQMYKLVMEGEPFSDNGATINAVAGRDKTSGTREAFDEKIFNSAGKSIKSLLNAETNPLTYSKAVSNNNSTGAVISKITSDVNNRTVGYISMGSYLANLEKDKTLKALAFMSKDQTEAVLPSVETVKDGTYAIQRPFVIVTKTNATLSAEAKAFYDWLWSEDAQELITNKGYVIK